MIIIINHRLITIIIRSIVVSIELIKLTSFINK